jgi:hypothetical protein
VQQAPGVDDHQTRLLEIIGHQLKRFRSRVKQELGTHEEIRSRRRFTPWWQRLTSRPVQQRRLTELAAWTGLQGGRDGMEIGLATVDAVGHLPGLTGRPGVGATW